MKAPSPAPSPPPQHQATSSKRTHATIVTHTHLGLRPKSPDSLHARIRSSHPQPKHISRIEDVVGSDTVHGPGRISRTGSVDSASEAYGGVTTGYEAGPSSAKQRKTNGWLSRDGSESGLTGFAYPSRSASPLGSQVASSSDLGQHSLEHSARSSTAGFDDDDDTYEIAYDDDNDDIQTTDIGIYRDEVYDEYLGPVMGAVRRMLVRSLRWESPILARHQRAVRTRRLDRYFVYTSLMGSHSFFLIFLPMTYWFVNGCFARGLVNVLAAGVYFSSAIKDALCIPRPYSPPVTRLVIGTTHLEYGFLSTHSTNCISIVLYVYLWLQGIRHQLDASSMLQHKAWEVGLVFYAVSVVYGRIYSGMHSIMDCLTGCVLGAAITLAQWYLTEPLEYIMSIKSFAVPAFINGIGIIMVMVHPQPLDDCPCFEDAIAFLSVVMGILTGRWWSVRYDFGLLHENPLTPGLLSSADKIRATRTTMLGSLGNSLNSSPGYWHAFHAPRIVLVLALGVGSVLATRVTVKTICRVVLPPIFRFVQGNLGFILPRRHYTSSTDYAAMQAQQQADDKAASGGVMPLSNDICQREPKGEAAHKRTTSWVTREDVSNTDPSAPRSRSHSLQGASAGTTNQVKFTLGDGKDLQVPFTHPNTNLPGDAISERIAGALSAEERARQHYEGGSIAEGGHKRAPSVASLHRTTSAEGKTAMSQDAPSSVAPEGTSAPGARENAEWEREEVQVRHYDVDVLTKVFVYHAIGFVASSAIPVTFGYIGLL